jgi:regulator of protease activity HflC (stomatin/prohibitin superfamily)
MMDFSTLLTPKRIATAVTGLICAVLLMANWPIQQVPTGHRGVVTVGGEMKGISSEGFLLVWPWQRLNVFNIRAEQVSVEKAEGGTADQQPVHVDLTVRYSVMPEKVSYVFEQYSKDGNMDSYVQTATQESFKAVTARYTAPELINKRAEVSSNVLATLNAKVAQYGVRIIAVDMKGFQYAPDYMKAINQKVTEDQLRQAADNRAKRIESEQQAKVVTALKDAEAARATADGQAYAVTKRAEAEANALRIQNAALRENKDVLELRRIEVSLETAKRWNGTLPTNMYANAPVPLLTLGGK